MAELTGNAIVAQSGGPTAVINASVAGVVQEAGRHEEIESIYGALNGILGVLDENIIDLTEEKAKTIENLKVTPAAALGTIRYKLKNLNQSREDYERILEVFASHERTADVRGGFHAMQESFARRLRF